MWHKTRQSFSIEVDRLGLHNDWLYIWILCVDLYVSLVSLCVSLKHRQKVFPPLATKHLAIRSTWRLQSKTHICWTNYPESDTNENISPSHTSRGEHHHSIWLVGGVLVDLWNKTTGDNVKPRISSSTKLCVYPHFSCGLHLRGAARHSSVRQLSSFGGTLLLGLLVTHQGGRRCRPHHVCVEFGKANFRCFLWWEKEKLQLWRPNVKMKTKAKSPFSTWNWGIFWLKRKQEKSVVFCLFYKPIN